MKMKSQRAPAEYEFACPACGESLKVNDAMRRALLDHGCVVCGEPAARDSFTEADRPG